MTGLQARPTPMPLPKGPTNLSLTKLIMNEPSIAHKTGMNHIGQQMNPSGLVPWSDAAPPETTGISRIGRLRSCEYCGSMHPADVATAIRAGAKGEWADMKYGWPHKAYFDGIPNPHAGLMEVRGSCNFEKEGWIRDGDHWHEPPTPAPETTYGKFYSVHLMDASPEDREVIEKHLGLHFEFTEDGKVRWKKAA